MDSLDEIDLLEDRPHHSIILEFSELLDNLGFDRSEVRPSNLHIIFERLNQIEGAMELLDKVIIANEPMIMHFLNRHSAIKNRESFQDLRYVVMYAALKYNPNIASFYSYSYKCMRGYFLNKLRDYAKEDETFRLILSGFKGEISSGIHRPVELDLISKESLNIHNTIEILSKFLSDQQCQAIFYYITLDVEKRQLISTIAECMEISPQRVRQLLNACHRNIQKVLKYGTEQEKSYLESIV